MRISDWSSDVCSSDLWSDHRLGNAAMIGPRALRLAGRTRSVEDRGEIVGAKLSQHGHGGFAFTPDACQPLLRGAIVIEQNHLCKMVGPLDRKSVVQGKSVSVSLVLGVRRII